MTPKATPGGQLQRRLLRDQVYDTILSAIIDNTLQPGDILQNDQLVTWLGASLAPIREALNRLAEEGVVELVPHKHTRVLPVDFAAINEALLVAGMLHEHAVRQTVGTLTSDQLDELDSHLANARAAEAGKDFARMGRSLGFFFRVFLRATRNEVLVTTVRSLAVQALRYLTPRGNLNLQDILARLVIIAEAARDGDADRAGDLVHELYAPTRVNFITKFRTVD